ncbi:MAG: hypothetical protein A2Y62_09640 [Candidatus Fischerbacteria bacterium RBG_13_37_8]|uniref:Fibronectin type-III domain-containing protein n=1 Tax=Candidatus Fischerbacteria bacterium RBG_13_37_8 TaxID=1817863 RepID=A0A1F5V5R7_9BACT|nr:MAG: hypothetical protein A2Y62_09640 [Candidatus Fischerbacteria bacterium RBG_13_37_8]
MSKIITMILVIGLILLSFCYAEQSPGNKDLVVINYQHAAKLESSKLPYIWRSADYFLAEWSEQQQKSAQKSSLPFEIIAKNINKEKSLYIFEIRSEQDIPSSWNHLILYRNGKEALVKMSSRIAEEWIQKGYHAAYLTRTEHFLTETRALVPFNCGYNALVDDLLSRTSQDQWMDWEYKITGVDSVEIGGSTYSILTRYSSALFNGNPNGKAYDFALQQAQHWHYGANIEEDPYPYNSYTWKNLILTIPGQVTPNEIVGISAHYDDMPSSGNAPGADDNASGSTMLFEAARLLRQFRFERTIKIMFFTGEEQGLIGSGEYVSDHPTSNILGVVNGDMFGWDGNNDKCFDLNAGTMASSQDVGHCLEDVLTSYSVDLTHDFIINGASGGSDHVSFWSVNVGSIFVFENGDNNNIPGGCVGSDFNPYYHTSGDNISILALPYTYDISRSSIAAIASMAIPVEACFTSTSTLSASTPAPLQVNLSWTSVPNANAYRIYRSTQGCYGQWLEQTETNTLNWIDTTVTPGIPYYYYVEAVASDGFCVSDMSNCVTATPNAGPHASYQSDTFTDYCSGAPGDGIIDPGESIIVDVTIINDGAGDLTGISGALSSSTPGITILDANATFPNILNGQTASSNPPHFTYSLDQSFTCGDFIDLDLALQYNEGSSNNSFTHQSGQLGIPDLTMNEDWESGGTGWTMSGLWHITDESQQDCFAEPYPSSSKVAYFGQDSSCDYDTGSEVTGNIDSPIVPGIIAATSELNFQFWREVEPGGGSYDQTIVYASPDGTNWTQVWYMDANTPPQLAWTASGPVSLSSFSGQSIRLRFKFDSLDDFYNNFDGWAVDNIQVTSSSWECTPCISPLPYLKPYNNEKPIIDDSGSPKVNSIIEPDEMVNLNGTLENIGAAAAQTVSGELSTSDPITINQANAIYPDIDTGMHQSCSTCYSITAPSANRTTTHWDFTVTENVSADSFGPVPYNYTYHVGESFADVPVTKMFYSFIETILHHSITGGCTASQYCPSIQINREQMAKLLCIAMKSSSSGACTTSACTDVFQDVPASNIFCPFIEALYDDGIVNGCQASPLLYCPGTATQRQAMAKLICLAMESVNPGSCDSSSCADIFADVSGSNPFCGYIEGIYNAGVISGCQSSPLLYCPLNTITREQMAKFIVNAMNFTL